MTDLKAGVCPADRGVCTREAKVFCEKDADCRGDQKCCQRDSCGGRICQDPVVGEYSLVYCWHLPSNQTMVRVSAMVNVVGGTSVQTLVSRVTIKSSSS